MYKEQSSGVDSVHAQEDLPMATNQVLSMARFFRTEAAAHTGLAAAVDHLFNHDADDHAIFSITCDEIIKSHHARIKAGAKFGIDLGKIPTGRGQREPSSRSRTRDNGQLSNARNVMVPRSDIMGGLRECAGCGAREMSTSFKRCSRCLSSWYCSQECLKSHWPTHKPECKRISQLRSTRAAQ